MKPPKKDDKVLFSLLEEKINKKQYRFLLHARKRQKDRSITEVDVIKILKGERRYNRRRNKSKDSYQEGREDWKYCIEGINMDDEHIRVIVTFEGDLMPIITVIKLI
ncbi:MAG: DUF4258 domain-containing protein [Gammaproteobacteria bacterium]|nr:MAG: DUF4258 domain-containing protein [Gammaproteobacteria bacterium]UTW41869.1 DUF4258 domain-containing protein [bacterium SCSIO 12844]